MKETILWLLFAAALYALAIASPLWDFSVYYRAGSTILHGLNPYLQGDLAREHPQLGPLNPLLPFLYHPLVLLLFAPFALFSWFTAAQLWMALNCVAIAALLHEWFNGILRRDFRLLLITFLMVLGAFHAPLVSILASGNPAALEALLIWKFLCFTERRRDTLVSAGSIVLASILKFNASSLLIIMPAATLMSWRRCLAILLVFFAAFCLPALIAPELFQSYISRVSEFDFSQDWFQFSLLTLLNRLLPRYAAGALYFIFSAAILFILNRLAKKTRLHEDPACAALIVLSWLMLIPRLKDYTLINAAPCAAVMCNLPCLLVIFMLSAAASFLPGDSVAMALLYFAALGLVFTSACLKIARREQ